MEMYGPYGVDLKFYITDGTATGVLTFEAAGGPRLDGEFYLNAREDAEDALAEQTGWRLMTKAEAVNFVIAEKTGSSEKFAITGGKEFTPWDKP